jgi:hypothetical protein
VLQAVSVHPAGTSPEGFAFIPVHVGTDKRAAGGYDPEELLWQRVILAGLFDRLASLFGGPPAEVGAGSGALAKPAGDPPLTADDPRLPDASRERVARLLSLVADVEVRALRDVMLAGAMTEVRQMRDQHLPQLVSSYAQIPAAHRAEIFRASGRSASYRLNEALDRMIAKAEHLSRALAKENIDSFDDNLRFIDQRYGSAPGSDPFRLD